MIDKDDIKIFIINLLKSFFILYIFGVVMPHLIITYGDKFLKIKISSSNSILVYNGSNNMNILNKIIGDTYIIFKLFFLI